MDLPELLNYAVTYKASDLHLTVGRPPMVRIAGRLVASGYDATLGPDDTKALIYSVLSEDQKARFEKEQELDFSLGIPGISRFRVNVFKQRGCVAGVFRIIGEKIPEFEELGLSEAVRQMAFLPNGLVVVTGPAGCGKSTTLAAMIHQINQQLEGHIVTIEDPIEYVHSHGRCTINQREVGQDTRSFPRALKSVLREDPNVILVGEMRDLETITAALTLAETGHLVLSTLHTHDAAQTVDRIIDVFPVRQQEQIRVMLAATLRGVIAQILVPRMGTGGRVAAREIMVVNDAISSNIRRAHTHQIYSVIQTSGQEGMCTMEESLHQMVQAGVVSAEEALARANRPQEFRNLGLPA
jgi:twitching motility protein PilT